MLRHISAAVAIVIIIGARPARAQSGITLSNAATLNTNASTDRAADVRPRIARNKADVWLTVWSSDATADGSAGSDTDIFFAVSTDHGATWSAPAALNTDAASDARDDVDPAITADSGGALVAVWSATAKPTGSVAANAEVLFSRSVNNGATWSAPALIDPAAASDGRSDRGPSIASKGAGTLIAAWQRRLDSAGNAPDPSNIFFARSTDAGVTWSPAAAIYVGAGLDEDVQLAADGAGVCVAVWTSTDTLAGTIGSDQDILFARSSDNGATWSAPQPLNSDAATDSRPDFHPQITTDGKGTWLTVWSAKETWPRPYSFLDVFEDSDLDLLVARSTDGGMTWSARQTLNTDACNNGQGTDSDDQPSIATDGHSSWVVLWTRGFGQFLIHPLTFAARSVNSGQTWTDPQQFNPAAPTDFQSVVINGTNFAVSVDETHPMVASDTAGQWLAVWQRATNGAPLTSPDADSEILFSRFSLPSCDATAADPACRPAPTPQPPCGLGQCGSVGCSWLALSLVGVRSLCRRRRAAGRTSRSSRTH